MTKQRQKRVQPQEHASVLHIEKFRKERSRQVEILPKNIRQEDYLALLEDQRKSIVFAVGPAGTGKTLLACMHAIRELKAGRIEKIIITKPIQESGENLGFLPGSMEDKLHPYKQSYYTTFCKILGRATVDMLFATEEIVFEPLAYMRGSTYDNCIMLLDECQNASIKQLMLWVTRLGKDSKAVMMGDTSQYDVRKKDSGYNDFIKMVDGMNDLCLFEFNNEDIVRNKFLIQIANRYDKYRSEQKEF